MIFHSETTKIEATSDETFMQDVLNQTEPVLAFFYSESCEACVAMASILERLAVDLQGEQSPAPGAVIVSLDTDVYSDAKDSYGVQGTPTTVLFMGGEAVAQHEGRAPASMFWGWFLRELIA